MQKFRTPVKLLLVLIFVLFVVQMYFGVIIREKKTRKGNESDSHKIIKLYEELQMAIEKETSLDGSGIYKIFKLRNNERGIENETFDITYVSQCSWNKLHLIQELLQLWNGPVSVAVFTERKYLEETLWKLAEIMHCYWMKDLSMQLVLQNKDVSSWNMSQMTAEMNVSQICNLNRWRELSVRQNYNWSLPYPVNLLRNVAKNSIHTKYLIITDIDFIPSLNLRSSFLRYIWSKGTQSDKIAFVVPAFEMLPQVRIPQRKWEILMETQKGNIRPFYYSACHKCQLLTNYSKWFSYPSLPGTRALYKVDWKHPWEPFYISLSGVPDFDERFKQYGYNRVSQICRLHVDGFSFLVLDNVFLIHRGFKYSGEFHESKTAEMKSNRKLYEAFKQELRIKSGGERNCDG